MQLGKLEKVNLRNFWKSEARDFTPWLAKDENICLLSKAVDLELEVQRQEESVGPFRADIFCKDIRTDHNVLIENQIEKTDHLHLGQLLTYAAGLDAVTIIWVAERFTEEHRASLDWLNKITDENINFFGIEIELYKIGDSPLAPKFNIVSKPNDWSKMVKRFAELSNVTDSNLLQLEYWKSMKNYFELNKSFLRFQKPQPQSWASFSIGKSYFHMNSIVLVRENEIRTELIISGVDKRTAKSNFEKLKNKWEEKSKQEIDDSIFWDEIPNSKVCKIFIKKSANVLEKTDWNNQYFWFKENLEKFYKFFSPKIKALV